MANTFRLQPERLEGLAAELEAAHAHDLCPALRGLRGVDAALTASWQGRAAVRFHHLYVGWVKQLARYGYELVAIAVYLRAVADEYRRLDGALHGLLPAPPPPAGLTGESVSQRYAAEARGAPYWAVDTYGNLRQLSPAERIAYARAVEVQRQLFAALAEMLQIKATSKEGALSVRLGLAASGQAESQTNPLGGLNRYGTYTAMAGAELGTTTRAGVFVDAAMLRSDTQHLVIGDEHLGLTLNHGGRVMGVDAFLGGQASGEGDIEAGVSIGAILLSLYAGLGLNLEGRNYSLFAAGGLQAKAGAVVGSDSVRVNAGPVSVGFEVRDVLDEEPWLNIDGDGDPPAEERNGR